MPQYVNKIKIQGEGSVRHIIGFGAGDSGYDVLQTEQNGAPNVSYYYMRRGNKNCVTVSKLQGRYFVEHRVYSGPDSNMTIEKKGGTLRSVSREFLQEAVKAYRAYRMLFNEYPGFRADILDAMKQGIECVYLGNMSKDRDRLSDLLTRSGFHIESFNFDAFTTKEGICISMDGMCYRQDEIIP